jgi:hypothetical protein
MPLAIKEMQFSQLGHGTLLHLRTLSELARPVQLQGFKRWKGTHMCERIVEDL